MKTRIIIFSFLFLIHSLQGQYISRIIEYVPAPGQYINTSAGNFSSAQSLIGTTRGMVNLGAFGGYIIFSFENPVENDPDNPFGIDFTVFGNALPDWSEPGIVSVMKDKNNNGLPDDTWYELAGSDYFFSSTRSGISMQYFNPSSSLTDIPWKDNSGLSGAILVNEYHEQAYYPNPDSFPSVAEDSYMLSGTQIVPVLDLNAPVKSYKRAFGYADNQLWGVISNPLPDNPYTPEVENSGGDAFDIDWAVDENGNYVDLDEVDFIRVHNSVQAIAGLLGEISPELTGARDVEPAPDVAGEMDILVLKDIPDTIPVGELQLEVFSFNRGRLNKNADLDWKIFPADAWVDEQHILHLNNTGYYHLRVSLRENPEIYTEADFRTVSSGISSGYEFPEVRKGFLYPNPAGEFITIKINREAGLRLYNTAGSLVKTYTLNANQSVVWISGLPAGVYIAEFKTGSGIMREIFIKK